MSKQRKNKEVVRRIIEEVFGEGNLEVIDKFFAPDYFDHSLSHAQLWGIGSDRDGFKKLVGLVREGLSDLSAKTEMLVAEGDLVAASMRAVGIHAGMYMGVPPTGRRIEVVDYHYFLIKNGKVVEHWNQYNTYEVMKQLGVIG